MQDENKTAEQLVQELIEMHQRLAALETKYRRTEELLGQCTDNLKERNQDLDDVASYVISEFRSPLGMIVGFAELLDQESTALSEEELRYCARTITESGRKMSKMVNGLLLLANSHRLFDNVWYAAYLAALGETSLSQWALEKDAPEAYRFTCLPASAAPLVVRAWRSEGETGRFQAVAKLGDQAGHDDESGLAWQEAEWILPAEEWSGLVGAVEGSEFWADSSSLEQLGWSRMVGVGGEEWIFEGWRDGQHKVRTVWNPDEEKAHAAHALGKSFVKSLPDWFALEMAQLWTADSRSEIKSRFKGRIDLDTLLRE
ncbi:MAG: hypothetical protein KKC18_02955 [Chloroflexi bacterium]|nr:hypothetical protein [Chloroflexota bacterium]